MSRFAVIGSPIGHSKSPMMHMAAFRTLGMRHVYEKVETKEADLPARIAALREGKYAGLNVTVPHKERVLSFVDDVDDAARAIGAANTLVRDGERIRALNTDAPALKDEIALLAGKSLAGRSALVLGSGGAARAAIFALRLLGVSAIIVRSRTHRPELSALAPVRFEPWSAPSHEDAALACIVQATTAGMTGAPDRGHSVIDVIAWSSVPNDAVVYDVIYNPRRTPLLIHAEKSGHRIESGLGMLVGQGALAFEAWLGMAAPRDAMRAAIEG
jgi:shikimate dehydrogenase